MRMLLRAISGALGIAWAASDVVTATLTHTVMQPRCVFCPRWRASVCILGAGTLLQYVYMQAHRA